MTYSHGATDLFAKLYWAEALRRRFPLSDAVPEAFEQIAAMLATADIGAARQELGEHMRGVLSAVRANRQQFLPLLQRRAAELEDGTLTRGHVVDLVTLLAQTGPGGVGRALEILQAQVAARHDVLLDTFYRAELLRGRQAPAVVAALYRSAKDAACSAEVRNPPSECERADWRLQQLEAIQQQEGG